VATEIVWASSERTIVHGSGDGGERPLAVPAVGSGGSTGAPEGVVAAGGVLALEVVAGVEEDPDEVVPEAVPTLVPVRLVPLGVDADGPALPDELDVVAAVSRAAGSAGVLVLPDVVAVLVLLALEAWPAVAALPAAVGVVALATVATGSAETVAGDAAADDELDRDASAAVAAGAVSVAGPAAADVAGALADETAVGDDAVAPAAAALVADEEGVFAMKRTDMGPGALMVPPAKEITSWPAGPERTIGLSGGPVDVAVTSDESSPANCRLTSVPRSTEPLTGPAWEPSWTTVALTSGADSRTATSTTPPGARTGRSVDEPVSTPAARSTPTTATTSSGGDWTPGVAESVSRAVPPGPSHIGTVLRTQPPPFLHVLASGRACVMCT
jgi:hypothetical protein